MAHKHPVEENNQKKQHALDKIDAHTSDHSKFVHLHQHTEAHTAMTLALHQVDRKRFYISQRGDFNYRSYMFGCGPSSLTEALADWGAVNPKTGDLTVHQPPTEADRRKMIIATGTMSFGKFPGGPDLMRTFAERYGLRAETHGPNINALDKVINQGKTAIVGGSPRPGHGHYIYVAGIDKEGYIVGDPAHYKVTHWTRQHLDHFMRGRRGFVAVWKGDTPNERREVVDAGGAGYVPSPILDRQASYHPVTGRRSGANGSLFRAPRPETDSRVARTDVSSPTRMNTSNFSSQSGASDAADATEARPPSNTEVASSPVSSNQSYGAAIPRTFPPPKVNQDVGDSTQDNVPDDASFEDSIAMQDTTDRIMAHVLDQNDAYTSVDQHDPPGTDDIAVGASNWHQQGDLPELFTAWAQDNPEKFKSIFGQDGQQLLNADWVKSHNFNQDPALMSKINEALVDPAMQQTQTRLTRQLVSQSVTLGYESGIRSQSGLAIVADACNQTGFGAVQTALRSPDVRTAIQQGNEQQAIAAMQSHLNLSHQVAMQPVVIPHTPVVPIRA